MLPIITRDVINAPITNTVKTCFATPGIRISSLMKFPVCSINLDQMFFQGSIFHSLLLWKSRLFHFQFDLFILKTFRGKSGHSPTGGILTGKKSFWVPVMLWNWPQSLVTFLGTWLRKSQKPVILNIHIFNSHASFQSKTLDY